MKSRQELVAPARRLVVKLGTGLLTDDRNRLDQTRVTQLADQVATLGRQVVLVSSGAIAAGMEVLGLTQRPKSLPELQACAAIGQSKLMRVYDELFQRHNRHVAQILLTHDDLKNRARHLNARHTLTTLLERGVIPIINENDTVSVDEIKFGDNDRLSALVAALIDADLLIILSHVEGLLDETHNLVSLVSSVTPDIEKLAGGTDRVTSVGGMKSKLDAAKIVTRAGSPMIIASGEHPGILTDLLAGQDLGTLFLPHTPKLASRKRWIAFFQRPAGKLIVDDGAKRALCEGGKSLLPKGVVRSEGEPATGDVISICSADGREFGRGLIRTGNVLVHRDDLVIL